MDTQLLLFNEELDQIEEEWKTIGQHPRYKISVQGKISLDGYILTATIKSPKF